MATNTIINAKTGEISYEEYKPDPKPVEELAEEARLVRDAMLSASDWTQVADAPVDQSAWATYRQALRDVPAQSGFPDDVIWPTPPV